MYNNKNKTNKNKNYQKTLLKFSYKKNQKKAL